jgi:hypothetical protein
MKFRVGDKAYKIKGYEFPCTIISVFRTTTGNVRVVAEMDNYGLLHIFNEEQLELRNKHQKRKINVIELLNFEGPVLIAHRAEDNFIITDEWKNIVGFFSKEEMNAFISGEISVKDNSGRIWIYPNESIEAKPNPIDLNNFIQ